jgi:hypothetical protein
LSNNQDFANHMHVRIIEFGFDTMGEGNR